MTENRCTWKGIYGIMSSDIIPRRAVSDQREEKRLTGPSASPGGYTMAKGMV